MSPEALGDGGVKVKRWEEEKRHAGQSVLLSIKRQHHDRRRSIKAGSCDPETDSKDAATPPSLPTTLCSSPFLFFFSFSPCCSSPRRFLDPRVLSNFSADPQGQRMWRNRDMDMASL